jgi:hypothetical protein
MAALRTQGSTAAQTLDRIRLKELLLGDDD